MASLKSAKYCAAFVVVLIALSVPAFAQTASDLLGAIKSSSAVNGGSVEVANLQGQMIITVTNDTNPPVESIQERGLALARIVASDKTNVKPLTILFKDKTSAIEDISFDAAKISQLADGNDVKVTVNNSESATSVEHPHKVLIASACEATDKYQLERAKVAARIDGLRSKGVGIAPFVQELVRVDQVYSHGGDALSLLAKLDGILDEQEKSRHDAQAVAAARTVNRMQPAAYKLRGTVVTSGAAEPSVASYNGSMEGFVSTMINTFVTKEVGQWVPHRGPFMVERIRIARRIHELETQNVGVSGVGSLYRNMEGIVASNDPRRLGELSMDVKYLQAQLGLSQLEGGLKKPLGI